VATGAVRYLSQFSDVTSQLGAFSDSDANPGFAGRPWLFSDLNAMVLKVMEGTSQAGISLADSGPWDSPVQGATARFRRLRLDVWVDPLRDTGSNIMETSAATANRGMAVFNAAHFRLQRTDPDVVAWGDLLTNGCQVLADITFAPVPDGDFLLRGTAYYGVGFTGWNDATE
jgi:hypothetical protein